MTTTPLKYIGLSHTRSFVKGDFTRHGIDSQGAVSFDSSNNWVNAVSPEAAEWLLSNDAEFREATQEDEQTFDETRTQPVSLETGASAPVVPVNDQMITHTTEGPRRMKTSSDGTRRAVHATTGRSVMTSVGGTGGSGAGNASGAGSSSGSASSGASGASGTGGTS